MYEGSVWSDVLFTHLKMFICLLEEGRRYEPLELADGIILDVSSLVGDRNLTSFKDGPA